MSRPLAYFLTWHTYGTWLHGHERGSVDREHRRYGSPFVQPDVERKEASMGRMPVEAVALGEAARSLVLTAMQETCQHRGWVLHAVHVRESHVHAVVVSDASPEIILSDLKAYATRRLRQAGLVESGAKVWAHHGSTRYLWEEASVWRAVRYTLEEQGQPMARWPESDVSSEPGA